MAFFAFVLNWKRENDKSYTLGQSHVTGIYNFHIKKKKKKKKWGHGDKIPSKDNAIKIISTLTFYYIPPQETISIKLNYRKGNEIHLYYPYSILNLILIFSFDVSIFTTNFVPFQGSRSFSNCIYHIIKENK